ncbi:hypothetical protein DFH27DRAFT_50584 [Peziza echinospora]|nr:hypothetical protein DFH27DRAFT_50584 [Peziza echinospora]
MSGFGRRSWPPPREQPSPTPTPDPTTTRPQSPNDGGGGWGGAGTPQQQQQQQQQQYTSSTTAAPQHTYSAGIPGPPRILVPPPLTLRADRDPNSLETSNSLDTLISTPAALQDWKYESRRAAQQILPWLWLGPLSSTRDKAKLSARGITLLIAVRSNMTAKAKLLDGHGHQRGGVASAFSVAAAPPSEGPRHITLDLPATPAAPLVSTFMKAAELIDRNYISTIYPELANTPDIDHHTLVREHQRGRTQESLPVPGSTLVFCETGNENSAVVVASYIMQHYHASVIQAVQIVQGRRFSVGFSDSMKFRLVAYEPIWQSYRQVGCVRRGAASLSREDTPTASSSSSDPQSVNSANGYNTNNEGSRSRKRGLDEDEDMEEQHGRTAAEARGAGESNREGVAPFRDDYLDEYHMDIDE